MPIAAGLLFKAFLTKVLIKYWYLFIIVALLGGGYWYVQHLQDEVEQQKAKVVQLEKTLDECIVDRDHYAATIKSLNDEVRQWEQMSAEQKKKFEALNGSLAKMQQQYNKRIQELLARPKPKTCDESIQFLIDAGRSNPWAKR
jgi:uncharacterized protein HemX